MSSALSRKDKIFILYIESKQNRKQLSTVRVTLERRLITKLIFHSLFLTAIFFLLNVLLQHSYFLNRKCFQIQLTVLLPNIVHGMN